MMKHIYGAGYRAGYCAAGAGENPYQFIRGLVWSAGWQRGMTDQLKEWLEGNREREKTEFARQLAVLTHVVYHHECSVRDARLLGGLLYRLEGMQDRLFPLPVTHYTA